ncbi:hypothetical protein LNKW23_32750 [Paralimibaculum aggregatum]|uniref:Sarcosine oxidase subunit gamma n=1 Tax=Paralimibaculum aggregatum TaxID=3036245 RepID=A0ABQ6LLI0_9RHOB|nr:hypothetical protein [Limibaculum sp. NKW23]GMG84061.1 hypothetical protein LNKW23_32750 [Limibaculum sp. NKW23]
MVERVSALAGHLAPRQLGIVGAGGPGLTLSERRLSSLWQIGAWPGRVGAVGAVVAAAAGTEAAPKPGRAATGGAAAALRTEALKWLLLSEAPAPALARPEVAGEDGTVLELSHARTVIRVAGSARGELMARLLPLDLRPGRFGAGQVAVSAMHGVGMIVLGREEALDLLVLRSFALTAWEQLLETGAQFGIEIG